MHTHTLTGSPNVGGAPLPPPPPAYGSFDEGASPEFEPDVALTKKGEAYAIAHALSGIYGPLTRLQLGMAIDALIDALDAADEDPDEEDDGTSEPTLGAAEIAPTRFYQHPRFGWLTAQGNQERWAQGSRREGEAEETNEDGGDILDEPHDPQLEGDELDTLEADELDTQEGESAEDCEPDSDDEDGGDTELNGDETDHQFGEDEGGMAGASPGRDRDLPIHPDHLPPEYIMQLEGTCMEPLVMDGSRWLFSRDEPAKEGDFVIVWLRPGFYVPGDHAGRFKRLVQDARPYGGGVIVEMINPPTRIRIAPQALLAVHKALRPADGIPSYQWSFGDALAQRAIDMAGARH